MKKLLWIVASCGLIVAAAVGLSRFGPGSQKVEAIDRETIRATRRDINSVVKATGVIKPMIGAEVRVGSRASGVVKRLFVRIGDRVQQGQPLAELDSRELNARRDAAQAAVQLAKANLTYAQTELRRKQELSMAGVIARAELDLATTAASVAEQQYQQARANLADAVAQLGYTRIFAPISGIVASVTTQEGETVAASLSAPTFVTLIDTSRLEVRAYVDETDIGRVRLGQDALFTVDTYGDQAFEGKVTAVYPQAEIRENVVDYVTVVRFAPPRDQTLRPEMTTAVRLVLEQRKQVVSVPIRAVRHESGRQYVTVRSGNAAERRWIKTGLRDESYCEVLNGLNEGEEVIVSETKKG